MSLNVKSHTFESHGLSIDEKTKGRGGYRDRTKLPHHGFFLTPESSYMLSVQAAVGRNDSR
jgi:hypothetical protein